jgi:microcystin-dependent protein
MELELRDYIIIFMVIIIIYLFYKKYIEKFNNDTTSTNIISQQVKQNINDVFKADLSKLIDLGKRLNNLNTDTTDDLPHIDMTVNDLNPDIIHCENIIINGDIDIEDINNFDKTFNIYPRYMVMIWTQQIIPNGWVICDGKTWYVKPNTGEKKTYDQLLQSIGASGVDVDEYASNNNYEKVEVPNLINRFVIGATSDNRSDTYSLNMKGGAETVVLTQLDLAPHYHNLPFVLDARVSYEEGLKEYHNFPQMAGDNGNYMGVGFNIMAENRRDYIGNEALLSKGSTYSYYPEHGNNTYLFYWYNRPKSDEGKFTFDSGGYAIQTDYARSSITTIKDGVTKITNVLPSNVNKGHNNMPPYYKLYYIMKI